MAIVEIFLFLQMSFFVTKTRSCRYHFSVRLSLSNTQFTLRQSKCANFKSGNCTAEFSRIRKSNGSQNDLIKVTEKCQ